MATASRRLETRLSEPTCVQKIPFQIKPRESENVMKRYHHHLLPHDLRLLVLHDQQSAIYKSTVLKLKGHL